MVKQAVILALVACGSSASNRRDAAPAGSAVDPARFLADLTTISAPRSPGSPHWQTVQDLCASRFEALGFAVERHAYATGVNVIGTRTGTRLPDERLLVSAHYDSVNACTGADDNATGVAATLEAARVLSLSPHDRTLVVACWDEEERGLIGSRAYATRAKAAGERVTGQFVFEMIGYRSIAPNSQRTDPNLDAAFPAQTAEIAANEYRGDFILLIHDTGSAALAASFDAEATMLALPAIALPVSDALKLAPAASGLRRSDHAPFWEQNFPSIQLTDTANFRNPHYHCTSGEDALADIDVEFATLIIKATVGATAAALDAK